jgi:hypothetical protein
VFGRLVEAGKSGIIASSVKRNVAAPSLKTAEIARPTALDRPLRGQRLILKFLQPISTFSKALKIRRERT